MFFRVSVDIIALLLVLIVIYKYKLSVKNVGMLGMLFLCITLSVSLFKLDSLAKETANITAILFVIAIMRELIDDVKTSRNKKND